MKKPILLSILIITFCMSLESVAQWSRDPEEALLLPEVPLGYSITSDSLGGVFVLGAEADWSSSYCTHINRNGFPGWNEWVSIMPDIEIVIPYGIRVSPEPGCVVAMLYTEQYVNEDTLWDFRAQKLNLDGERMWPDSGVSVTTRERNIEGLIEMGVIGAVSDGEGGLIVLWNVLYYRMISEVDRIFERQSIRAQRLTSDGESLWGDTGMEVIDIENRQSISGGRTVSDGSGGVIMVFSKSSIDEHIIGGQRISSQGDRLWGDSGVLYELDSYLAIGEAVSDNHRGVIFSGQAVRDSLKQIRVFRFGQDGNQIWGDGNGLVVREVYWRTGGVGASWLNSATDSIFFINWVENVSHPYVQAIDLSGELLWNSPGVTICDADTIGYPILHGVGSMRSVIYGWRGDRPGNDQRFASYCQRLDEHGNKLWADEGVLLFNRSDMIITDALPDGYGGTIFKIGRYLQLVNRDGELGVPLTIRSFDEPLAQGIIEYTLFPNPTNGAVTLSFFSQLTTERQITLFDLQGRPIFQGLIPRGALSQPLDVSAFPSGSYILQIQPGASDAHRTLNIIK